MSLLLHWDLKTNYSSSQVAERVDNKLDFLRFRLVFLLLEVVNHEGTS